MPQVPRLSRQVDERAMPVSRVPTDSPGIEVFGGGRAIAQAIQGAGEIVQDAYETAAKNQILKADSELTNATNELLYSPESGAMNLKGEDAFQSPDYVDKAYKANVEKIEEGLTNPMAKAAFKRMAAEKRGAIGQTLNKHISNEMDSYSRQVAKSFADSKMNFALSNYQNPDIVKSSIDDVMVAIDQSPAYRGMAQQVKDQMKLEYASGVHKSVIERMIDNGDDLAAQKYFEANRSMIAGKDFAAVEKDLQNSSVSRFAQSEADRILSQTRSYRQALQMANEITKDDPRKRQALNENIQRQLSLRKQAEQQDVENLHQYVGNLLDENKGDLSDPRIQRVWDSFSIAEKKSIEQRASDIVSGRTIETDRDYYTNLRSLAVNNPDAFKRMNLNSAEVKNKLSRSDWDKVFKEQRDLRQGKESKELKLFRGDEQVARSILSQNKVKNKEKQALFMNKFYPALEKFREENGRSPRDTEMQMIANQLMVEVVTEKGLIWDTKKRAFEMEDDEQIISLANPEDKKRIMTASSKPKTVMQNGKTFRLNEATGKYERVK